VVSSGGVLVVSAGGLAVSTTVNSTGIGFNRGALALSGGIASGTTINSGGQEGIFAGGTNIGATVSSGGGLFVHSGLASRTTLSGGLEVVFAGGQTVSTTVTSTGVTGSNGGLANLGGIDIATVINNNAHAGVFSGGTDIGATVNKGGVLYVHSGGTAANTTVKSGGLEVLETGGVTTGTTVISIVSGFGQNVHQFIDFTAIGSAGATLSYTSTSSNSGVLTVISGGTSASIHLSGQHTQASFQITSGVGGSAEIFDPPVGVQQATFGSPETLGYIEKIVETAIGDIFAGKFALLCNYMASEFANTIGGHVGALPTEPQQMEQQPVLTHPHTR
jgi:fibronectin-binding autotransporter adhesin